jgi:predicted O-linked N-acetylglucosamine transferase (SPINDLY family)
MTSIDTAEIDALVQEGRSLHQQGRLDDARLCYERALQVQPRHFFAQYLLGVIAYQTGEPAQSVALIRSAIRIDPRYAKAHNHLGNALLAMGEFESAIESYCAAVALDPNYAEAMCNRGNAYFDLGEFATAIESFDQAIDVRPGHTLAYTNRGLCQLSLGRYAEALADFDTVIALDANNAEAHNYKGHALRESENLHAALGSYETAIALRTDYAEALNGRGSTFAAMKEYETALQSYDAAIRCRPDFAEAHLNRGNVLKELCRWQEALASYGRALHFKADLAEAYLNRGNVQRELRHWRAALVSYDHALELKPDLAEAYFGRGNTRRHLGDKELAVADFDRAATLKPDFDFLQGLARHVRMGLCDWRGMESDVAEICARIERGEAGAPPFPLLALVGSPALQRRAAEIWVRETCPAEHVSPAQPRYARHERIRVGYFSADFRNHPVAYLAAGLFEAHDRSRFEVIAFSLGPDTRDEMTQRLKEAFEHFVDVSQRSDQQIAGLAGAMELDIAVDLGGFTEGGRPGVFSRRAAPLQLSYLGYLGTMGAPYIDYLIADAITVPADAREHYTEKILYLPSFQANDSKRRAADKSFGREELGLPARGFVFCCFNSPYKITPEVFAAWMRILGRVPGSVLLLHADGPAVERNLRAEALRRGADPARLIFGGWLPQPEYLARYRAADLFLDTLPYNAGTTASDALWAGLPVMTCVGEAIAGRVAASLLTAVGLPELITSTLQRYEDLAVDLAHDPERLAAIKRKLIDGRVTAPLFDTERFTRQFETGLSMVYERYQAGLAGEHLVVPPCSASRKLKR